MARSSGSHRHAKKQEGQSRRACQQTPSTVRACLPKRAQPYRQAMRRELEKGQPVTDVHAEVGCVTSRDARLRFKASLGRRMLDDRE